MEENNRDPNAIDVLVSNSTKLESWTAEIQGEGPFLVLFNSEIYKNAWWVDAGKCPGNVNKDGIDHNPWRKVRNATDFEIVEHGNPISCEEIDVKINNSNVQAWTATLEGEGPFHVIFNGKIYKNAWWADAGKCPGNVNKEGKDHNPWRKVRNATAEEITEHGNPIDCDKDVVDDKIVDDKVQPFLVEDRFTLNTYKSKGLLNQPDNTEQKPFKRNGEGYHLSFTSARVSNSVYNGYQNASEKPKLCSYITDWCQYDARLDAMDDASKHWDKHPLNPNYNPKDKFNGAGRGFDLNKIDATAYDRLIFSFIGIYGDEGPLVETITKHGEAFPSYPEGHITLVDFWGDLASYRNIGLQTSTSIWQMEYKNFKTYQQSDCQGLLGGLRELKRKNPDLTLGFSIGGWTMSGFFSKIAAESTLRNIFIKSVVDFFKKFPMFDAVDIDWEYPSGGGLVTNSSSPADGKNYALLIKELRKALDYNFSQHKEITIAASAVKEKISNSNIPSLIDAGLDNIYLMAYDFFGTGWSQKLTHHTNLRTYNGSEYSVDAAVSYLVDDLNIKSTRIHLGYANYGRSAKTADIERLIYITDGYSLGTFENGAVEFYDCLFNYLDLEAKQAQGKNNFILYTDEDADADFLFNPNTNAFISLDTPRTVKLKGEFITKRKLGGAFAWSADQDNGLLANAAREGMGYKVLKQKIDMSKLYNKGKRVQWNKNNS